jgi:hypothetical protein
LMTNQEAVQTAWEGQCLVGSCCDHFEP